MFIITALLIINCIVWNIWYKTNKNDGAKTLLCILGCLTLILLGVVAEIVFGAN